MEAITQITSQAHLFLELALVLIRAAESWKGEELDISFNSVHKTKLVILAFCISLTKRIKKINTLIAKLSCANNLDVFSGDCLNYRITKYGVTQSGYGVEVDLSQFCTTLAQKCAITDNRSLQVSG